MNWNKKRIKKKLKAVYSRIIGKPAVGHDLEDGDSSDENAAGFTGGTNDGQESGNAVKGAAAGAATGTTDQSVKDAAAKASTGMTDRSEKNTAAGAGKASAANPENAAAAGTEDAAAGSDPSAGMPAAPDLAHDTTVKAAAEPFMSEEDRELQEAKERYAGRDRNTVWAFTSGQASEDFRGNPKYLFVYINRYRKDLAAYWLCSSEETIAQVRGLGFIAHREDSPAAQYAIDHTGVLVAEQVKAFVPEGFENVKYLNLWHGVGFKRIERKLITGDLAMNLARKYIQKGTFYRDHQLMTVTSPLMEEECAGDCGVDEDKCIRTGYLRCLYQQNFEPVVSFDHDLRARKGLDADTKLVVYAPTYRAKLGGTFARAITDLEALYRCCERNNLLLIFKVHPNMETEDGFLRAWKTYGDRKYFWFWDNRDDFYEIMDQIDLAIVDYSAIFSDMVAVGIRHYIRYIFDYEEYIREVCTQDDYFGRTAGKICRTFEELIAAIDTWQERDDSSEFQRIRETFWAYDGGKDDFEKTIRQVMDFKVQKRSFPCLYSFDVFDTLITRKVLEPVGIFYAVQEKIVRHGGFPLILERNYPEIRHSAERNVREFYAKSIEIRKSERVEITFDEIFRHLAEVYPLSGEQLDLLKKWELEAELENVVPLEKQIRLIKEFLARGETVILISDMYLDRKFLVRMLEKADPVLAELPLFLSGDYGVLKTSQQLFFEVYKSFQPFYDFNKWIHFGDNVTADQTRARQFRICTRRIERPELNRVQKAMTGALRSCDGYRVAALQARMCAEAIYEKDEFVISYLTLCMVPYIDWVLRDAVRRGYGMLYFISRDGHPLKRIADAIIRERRLDIRTKYIYASRRAWRIPSFIHEVDEGFWLPYGNFEGVLSAEKLFRAMDLDEQTFREFFPTVDPDTIHFADKKEMASLTELFRDSGKYREYLLEKAKSERVLVSGYLKQEIAADERFAIVEYFGRGFTQDCMIRLWHEIIGEETDVPFYYSRSVLPTLGHAMRYNFTTNESPQFFLEGVFANMPYKSVERYEQKNGKIVPVIVPLEHDADLFDAMERLLPAFAARYAALELDHPEDTDHMLYEFALDYFRENQTDEFFLNNIATLKDSIALYGKKREFAPPYTMEDLDRFAAREVTRGRMIITTSMAMSAARASSEVRERYCEMYQILPGEPLDSGRMLSEKEIRENRKYKRLYEELRESAGRYRALYEKAAAVTEVKKNLVLFVLNGKDFGDSGLEGVFEKAKLREELETEAIFLGAAGITAEEVTEMLAQARFILISDTVKYFCEITFRKETDLILLNNVAFPLYNHGLAVNYFLKWRRKYVRYAGKNDISVLQVPSRRLEERFRRYYSGSAETKCDLMGCCQTDLYFETGAGEKARKKVEERFPEAAGKKLLLYMPTVRLRKKSEHWISMIDMDVLQERIGDRYAVVLNFNSSQFKKEFKNTFEIPGFSRMMNDGIRPRELMLAADVIVGDYRDTFFETALLEKPVYFTVSDYEEIIKSNNMYAPNEFDSYIFGPVVADAIDLTEALDRVGDYDYEPMRRFRREMFAGCDGNSAKRAVELMISECRRALK